MESSILLNLERSYLSVKEDFKKVIKDDDELKNQLFETETSSKARKVLSSNHLKPLTHMKGAKPEAVTTQHILKLFNEIGIPQELIIPEVRLKIINGFRGKPINRYPDLAITNQSFKKDLKKNLLFEIEALNKDLTTENDGEGIEQALKWYHQSIGLYRDYNAIITNFNEWYLLKFNKKDEPVIKKKKPLEILELIYETTLGHGTEYFEDEEGEEISKNFYAEFSKRLKMLINPTNNNIKILGIRDSSNLIEQERIDYYRTIFHRLLFIKILLDWKLFDIDPVQEIFQSEEKRNIANSLRALFFRILNNPRERVDVLDSLKNLPFLNGGLFRLTELEQNYPSISLNSDAIIDIWSLLKGYNFIASKEINKRNNPNDIDPNILGYIFEKSIGDFRKSTGAYYTRSSIANYTSRNTIYRYIFYNVNKKFPKYQIHTLNHILMYEDYIQIEISDYIIEILKNIKICDPFVGSGAFLVSIGNEIFLIYKFIYKNVRKWSLRYKENKIIKHDKRPFVDICSLKSHIVQNNLYGIDINNSAIDICKLRLWLWITKPPSHLDLFNLILEPLPNFEYNVLNGNSFIGYTKDVIEIEKIDKTTGNEVKFVSIREWGDKKEYSISQMLEDRNTKIKNYYKEKDLEKKESLKKEITDSTTIFNRNFDFLLLNDFKNKEITSKTKKIKSSNLNTENLDNLYSMNIKAKKGTFFKLTDNQRNRILADSNRKVINGIILKKNSITIKNRVFEPKPGDKFKPQDPLKIFEKISKIIDTDSIDEIELRYFIDEKGLEKINRFHWSMEFSDIFNTEGFDIIITNPPYGNILSPLEKKILSKKDSMTEDIYINFLEKLSRKEIPFKFAGILAPKSYLLRQKYIDFRNSLINNNSIYEITDIGSKQFQGATNEVQILFLHSDKNFSKNCAITDFIENEKKIIYEMTEKFNNIYFDKLRICRNKKCKYYDAKASFYYYSYTLLCPICNEKTFPLNRIRLKISNGIFDIINKIEQKGNLNYLNSKDFPKMIRGEEDKGLKSVKEILNEDIKGTCSFISAKEDLKYYYVKQNKSFNIEEIDSSLLKGNDYEYYLGSKLLIKHNNIIPEALFTQDNICFTSSIYSLLYDEIYELKYLCAILNSSLIQFYCIYGINNQKDTTINLNQYMIRHLPIVNLEDEMKKKIARKVDKITQNLKINGGKINEDTKEVIRQIDDLIFKLYSITENEISIILTSLRTEISYFKEIYEDF